ncbi:hypothetical protein C7A09_02035 [Pseudomonas fluorescens]|nr:hypothetical protein C7A09_02035 [Pseudomonas fluorescens]
MRGDAERHGLHSHAERGSDLSGSRHMLVPTLCVVTPPGTLRVPPQLRGDAERHGMHSHAERGNDLPGSRHMLVPTLCVVTPPRTLRVRPH